MSTSRIATKRSKASAPRTSPAKDSSGQAVDKTGEATPPAPLAGPSAAQAPAQTPASIPANTSSGLTELGGAEPPPLVAAVLAAALSESVGVRPDGSPAPIAAPLPMSLAAPRALLDVQASTRPGKEGAKGKHDKGDKDKARKAGKDKHAEACKARHKHRAAAHADSSGRPSAFVSPWNKAPIVCVPNPNPALDTHQAHVLELPELCPSTQNPLPGSTIVVHYKGKAAFLDAASLSAYIRASIGHPMAHSVEALTQAVALDCAQALQQKVHAEGRFLLRGLAQTVVVKVEAKPRRKNAAAASAGKRKDRKA